MDDVPSITQELLALMMRGIVRISAHIESQQLLPSCQSAYTAHHSTETAIVAVHDFLIQSIDSGDVCALVLLDLSAAFDTVDHQSLLQAVSYTHLTLPTNREV